MFGFIAVSVQFSVITNQKKAPDFYRGKIVMPDLTQ